MLVLHLGDFVPCRKLKELSTRPGHIDAGAEGRPWCVIGCLAKVDDVDAESWNGLPQLLAQMLGGLSPCSRRLEAQSLRHDVSTCLSPRTVALAHYQHYLGVSLLIIMAFA